MNKVLSVCPSVQQTNKSLLTTAFFTSLESLVVPVQTAEEAEWRQSHQTAWGGLWCSGETGWRVRMIQTAQQKDRNHGSECRSEFMMVWRAIFPFRSNHTHALPQSTFCSSPSFLVVLFVPSLLTVVSLNKSVSDKLRRSVSDKLRPSLLMNRNSTNFLFRGNEWCCNCVCVCVCTPVLLCVCMPMSRLSHSVAVSTSAFQAECPGFDS